METFNIDSRTKIIFKKNDWELIIDGINQSELPKYIYKYYALNEFSLDALKNSYFYLSNPKDFNDPFDCNRNLILEEQRELKDCEYIELLNDISDIGIVCFSENGMEPLMWSHYTNSYKGICLKINTELLIKRLSDEQILKAVIYSENPNSISINAPFAKYYQYFLKLNNWNYEKEWRFLHNHPNLSDNRIFYNSACIEEISLGYKFFESNSNVYSKKFDELILDKFSETPLMIVGPHQTKLKLEKVRLKYGTVEDGLEIIQKRLKVLFG